MGTVLLDVDDKEVGYVRDQQIRREALKSCIRIHVRDGKDTRGAPSDFGDVYLCDSGAIVTVSGKAGIERGKWRLTISN